MSTCISHHGEYGSHTLDSEGFWCMRCGELDDVALTDELRKARDTVARLREALERLAKEPKLGPEDYAGYGLSPWEMRRIARAALAPSDEEPGT